MIAKKRAVVYNINSFAKSAERRWCIVSEQWLYNSLTILVIISSMSVMLKLQKPAKRPEKNNPANETQGAELCEEELLAVITAAIQAFTDSAEFKVVRIKLCSNNWILSGRQGVMANRI